MENLWNEVEAREFQGEPGQIVYATRLLGRDPSLGLYRTGNASVKRLENNSYGEEEEILYIESEPQPGAEISAGGFTPVRRTPLCKLARLDSLAGPQLENELACSRTRAAAPVPPLDALLHAVLPYPCVLSAQPDAVLAAASTLDGSERLRQIYGGSVLVLPYATSGLALARACSKALETGKSSEVEGIFVMQQGLFTFGDTPQLAYQRMADLVNRAGQYLEQHASLPLAAPQAVEADSSLPAGLPALRKAISTAAGFPLILCVSSDPVSLSVCRRADLADVAQAGPAVAGQAALTRLWAMPGRDVEAYRGAYRQAFQENIPAAGSPAPDFAPRVVLDPDFGMGALGRTAGEAALAGRIFRHNLGIFLSASALGGYRGLPMQAGFEAERATWRSVPASQTASAWFTGEVALVTGGASGIGKASVESLLARGAAVVSLDINPAVKNLFPGAEYLGLECDLTDESAILRCFEALVRAYGGLDMLVLNAGIFPAGCRLEALSLADWQKVTRINLDSNVVLLREAYPLLKYAPNKGRVLVNASKNVLAPGAGAAAYSASKAAVTQLARVAALEWGKDQIRVNIIHPDAIFDTGIWTEDVLKTRAAHYGMTVQQYKTRNVLGVELNSHYVGELVAEMLGPRFEKITGAQIAVDGGSDRVI